MIGVALNAAGIVIGGVVGLTRKKPLIPANEQMLKLAVALGAIGFGLQLVWKNVNGSFGQVAKQLFIVLISMSLGKLLGKLLHLQKFSNSLGHYATDRLTNSSKKEFNDGFIVTALLACANPLAIFAAVDEGLSGFSLAFVVKALMDGLAAMSFVTIFGWGVLVSFIPVVAFQGTIVLLIKATEPFLKSHGLLESVCATNGLLIFSASLIILSLKKIELTDYLPSLAVAPLITWLWT
jgi:uncharacterized membrane protein YqgA involved in biofilm formation